MDSFFADDFSAGLESFFYCNADAFDYWQTMVIYDDPALADRAQGIVDVMGEGVAMQNDGSYVFSTDFLVVVGQDYAN